ncbi:MAG: hypothetical protein AMXMBFR56_03480 [Polyangiaceae bacterium]
MEVSCTSCPARFAVPDDKVRGRKVRIACKRCGSPIIVDGTSLGGAAAAAPGPAAAPKPAAAAPKPAAAAPKPAVAAPIPAAAAPIPAAAAPKPAAAAAPKPAVVAAAPKPAATPAPVPRPGAAPAAPRPAATAKPPAEDNDWSALSDGEGKTGTWREPASAVPPSSSVPRPAGAQQPKVGGFAKKTMLGGLEAPRGAAPAPPSTDKLGTARPAVPAPRPSAPEPEEAEPEWTVALTDDQHEEMRTAEVVQLYARGSIDQETFIWADGMEDWKRPWEIPMIAAALAARGLKPKAAISDSEYPMDEPAEEDATIVASADSLMAPSSRGRIPSGVWHEPGRDDNEVGFEDVTVSLDGKSAQDLLASIGGAGAARPAQKSKPELLAEQFDDVPTRLQDEIEAPPPSVGGHDVDDLLSDMDERTLAMQDDFRADSRPLSTADLMTGEDRTIPERHAPATGESFSLENLMGGPAPEAPPGQPQDLFAGVDLAPPPPGRDRPLDSLWEPTSIQQASNPMASPAGISGGYPAALPQMAGPGSLSARGVPQKKSRLGCVLGLLFVLLVIGGGAAASFVLKQPPGLYGADGMPKIPGLSR